MRYSVLSVGIIAISMVVCSAAIAQDKAEGPKTVAKEFTGMVSGISAGFIAVDGGVSAESKAALEMAFNLDKDVKVVHKKNLSEIVLGDTVTIHYNETTQTSAEGRTMRSTRVREIVFVAPAPKELSSQEEQNLPQAGNALPQGAKGEARP